jgi:N-acetyl-gamma-glutamylphosphate reductase
LHCCVLQTLKHKLDERVDLWQTFSTSYSNEYAGTNSAKAIGVALLGCTGSVGQRFILLLADHPVLSLHAVGASSRSAGKKYKDAVRWKQSRPMSNQLADLEVRECKASNFQDCDLVFSGLDSDVAGDIGMLTLLLGV